MRRVFPRFITGSAITAGGLLFAFGCGGSPRNAGHGKTLAEIMTNDFVEKCPDIPSPIISSFVQHAMKEHADTPGMQASSIQCDIRQYRAATMSPKEKAAEDEREFKLYRDVTKAVSNPE